MEHVSRDTPRMQHAQQPVAQMDILEDIFTQAQLDWYIRQMETPSIGSEFSQEHTFPP